MQADALVEEASESLNYGRRGIRFVIRILNVPVLANANSGGINHQRVSRLKAKNVLKHRSRAWYVSQRKVLIQSFRVYLPQNGRNLQERLDLRSKGQHLTVAVIIQRLYSQTISRQQEAAPAPVPDCEGEHAPQTFHAFIPVLLICVKDCFCVRPGPDGVARSRQLSS